MNRLRQLFGGKPSRQERSAETHTCANCGRQVLTSREWYDDYESKGYWVNRLTGEAIFEGERYCLDPLLIPSAAITQEHARSAVCTRGYQCMACGQLFCAICMIQAPQHPQTPRGRACPGCGGEIRTLEKAPTANQLQSGYKRIETRNWTDLTVSWMFSPESPQPELWLLCANVAMAETLVQRRPGATGVFLTAPPQMVEFPDGTGAATFELRRGEHILKLVDCLMQGEYGTSVVTLGGAAKWLPEADEATLQFIFKTEECIKHLSDTIIWRGWGFFAINN